MFPKARIFLSLSKNKILKRSLSASVIDQKIVLVQGEDHNSPPMKFPSVWLRDNCQCSQCFHDHTKSRKINWERINSDNKVAPTFVTVEQKTLTIDWQDKHRSIFDLNWLKERDFAPERQKQYLDKVYKPPAILWGKDDFKNILHNFEFKDVLNNDSVLLAWLEAVATQGFAIIKNSPHDKTVARQLADRIGFIKRTTYGEVFEVKSKENARNYAYLMTPLPLHTDMNYYEYKAGINILHCFVQSQSKGGANLLTDGFNIAEKLRRDYPKYYEHLLKTPVDWHDMGKDNDLEFHNIHRAPVIGLDVDGNYHRINHNATKRDSHFSVSLEEVEPWYEAYDKFLKLSYAEAVEFKTKPGDVFVFNNLRILHGRTAYEDSPANKRHLIGAYVDWDIVYSKIRTLRLKNNL